MSSSTSAFTPPPGTKARTKYRIRAADVSKIICHRQYDGDEQFLVRWKTDKDPLVPPGATCSWHGLSELGPALHHVQTYIETRPRSNTAARSANAFVAIAPSANNRKRKSPGSDPPLSREGSYGTPRDSAYLSREASVTSLGSTSSTSEALRNEAPWVYNGLLQRKEGKILPKKSRDPNIVKANAAALPNKQMLEAAARAPVSQAEQSIRIAFEQQLAKVKNVRWENQIDDSAPSLDFTFINDFKLREGVYRPDSGALLGCDKPCKPNMGQGIGCEYPRLCSCLEYAAVNEAELEREDPKRYQQYLAERTDAGYFFNTEGLPKRFPYKKPNDKNPNAPTTLQAFYLKERYPIYECNVNCNCGDVCKSRVVQKGRKIPLVIFKTQGRGWGVYCDEDLLKGEFIDTYIGEVLTNEETDRREAKAGKDKASYLYALDKFVGDDPELTDETCYVVDGQYMGGPTRFINHSCEPNCRQYTVSYNKHDLRIYDLAFFAVEDIPAGTELTFDYMDKDEEEVEDVLRERARAAADPKNEDKKPCNCGAEKCRGYLWV